MKLYNDIKSNTIDTRKRRRFYKFAGKIQRISIVVLAWLFGSAILYGIYNVAFIRPYFKVEEIKISGLLNVNSEEDIIKLSGIEVGDHLLRIPVDQIQKNIASNEWVKEVAVHRKLPHLVWIYVKEYIPEAIVRKDDWYYMDSNGHLFKKVSIDDDKDYPVITGLEDISEQGSGNLFNSRLLEALKVKRLYETFPTSDIYGISEIHFDENKGISIITLNDPIELKLGFGPFREKIERLQKVYRAIRNNGGIIAYIDLRPEGKAVVKYEM